MDNRKLVLLGMLGALADASGPVIHRGPLRTPKNGSGQKKKGKPGKKGSGVSR
jgi:hypothetical protein